MIHAPSETEFGTLRNPPLPSLFLLPASLLVMLNLPLLFTRAMGVDQYSYIALEVVSSWATPLTLSFLTNTFLALLGYGCHLMLWRWQYRGRGREAGTFQKAAIVVGAPVFLAFMPSFLLTPHGGQGFPVLVAFLLFASMTITMAVRDPETRLTPQETTLWLWGAIGVIIVLLFTVLVVFGLLMSREPLPPTGNLFWAFEIPWERVGYGPEEYARRHLEILPLFTTLSGCYMIFIVGGAMLGAISARRKDLGSAKPWTEVGHLNSGQGGLEDLTDRESGNSEPAGETAEEDGSPPGERQGPSPILQQLWERISNFDVPTNPAYEAVWNGQRVGLSESMYRDILQKEGNLIGITDLYVNMKKQEIYMNGIPMRFGWGSRSSLLTCVYAGEPPGKPLPTLYLQKRLIAYLGYDPGQSLNVPMEIGNLIVRFKKEIITRDGLETGWSKIIEGRDVLLITPRDV